MPNFLDNAISYFAPSYGLRRLQARYAAEFIEKTRSYDAASNGKRHHGWKATGASANTEISAAGSSLRFRSRALIRNNPYAMKAVNTIATNVVGSGIRPSIRHKEEVVEMKAKALWESWAESTLCDFDGNVDFYGAELMTMRGVAESGEIIIRRVWDRKAEVPFKIQLLEPDHIDNSKDGIALNNGGYIQLGIEYNKLGKRVAYWLFDDHPGEQKVWRKLTSSRVPAKDIIHTYVVDRPGQSRGVPFGVSTFDKLRDFEQYEEAQLIRQKIAACFAVFVHTDQGSPTATANPNGGAPIERLEPGTIEYLPPGQDVTFGDPPTVEGYDIYTRKVLQGVAAGYGITYEGLTNDLSNVNFSSGRMGWIEFGRQVYQWQNQVIIQKLCKGVWSWFIQAMELKGELPSDVKATWTPPRREMIDPLKETKGINEQIRAGLKSWQDAVRELGRDPDVVLAELIADKKRADDAGLMLTSDPEHDANRSQKGENVEKPKEEEEEEEE